jgi:hypothetical protein
MARIEDPRDLDHPDLRDIGIVAAWLAKVADLRSVANLP